MKELKRLLGYFSQQCCDRYGYDVVKTETGVRVDVTCVIPSGMKPYFKWPDEKFVGFVTEYIEL